MNDHSLGKRISRDVELLRHSNFFTLVRNRQGRGDLQSLPHTVHPARNLLQHYHRHGAPVVLQTAPWTQNRLHSALERGPHKSAYKYLDFLRDELTEFIDKNVWMVFPYDEIKHLPNLRISPIGAVPQHC